MVVVRMNVSLKSCCDVLKQINPTLKHKTWFEKLYFRLIFGVEKSKKKLHYPL